VPGLRDATLPTDETDSTAPLRFGPFRLDLVGGQLLRGTEAVHLRPKTWEVLRVLAGRAGELVTHRELLDTVWADAAVVPQVLTNTVRELRRALGEGPRGGYVETVARRGFRFVPGNAPAEEAEVPSGFIGRTDELAWLTDHWQRARDGRRTVALVAGAPGIGKTTLVETFATRIVSAAGGGVLWGRCLEQHTGAEPFFPVLSALGAAMRSDLAETVRAALGQYARRWLAQIPGAMLAADLTAPGGDAGVTTPGQMLREGAALLEGCASVRPLLLVLDDLQWVDGSTLDLLALLSERSDPAPLLVVGTYRPAEALAYDSGIRAFAKRLRQRQRAELALESFSAREVRDYLADRFDTETACALEDVAAEHSGGVPLYLRLAADHYESHGRVRRTTSGWELTAMSSADTELPDDIGDLVMDQYRGLEPSEQALVRAASLCGGVFGADLLARVLQWPSEEAARTCRALADRGQLFVYDAEEDGYRFRHDVHRRVIESRVHDDPRPLHRTIAEVLEASQHEPGASEATVVAHHLRAAGEPERAAAQLERAAFAALALAGYREAAANLRAALTELSIASAAPNRASTECRLQQLLGTVLLLAEGYGSPNALRAAERAGTLGDALGQHDDSFRASNATTLVLLNSGRVSQSVASAERTAEIARLHLPERQAFADVHRGYAYATAGDFRVARDHLESALRSDQSLQGLVTNAEPVARVVLGMVLTAQGHLGEAREMRERAVALAEAYGDPLSLTLVLFFASVVAGIEHDAEVALAYSERVYTLSDDLGLRSANAGSTVITEWARGDRATGPWDGGRMREACAERRRGNERWGEGSALALLATLQVRAGVWDAAQADVDAGLAYVRMSGDGLGHVDLLCAQAEILRARARPDDAEARYHEAMALADRQHAALFRLRAANGLGDLLATSSRPDEAHQIVSAAVAALPERTPSADLTAAEALLARIPTRKRQGRVPRARQ